MIIDRAHHSISQHRGDVHHLIEHHNRIHKYRNKKNTHKNHSQKGGDTNNLHTILTRAGHTIGQHHGDLTHHVILKRTSKSIRDFHNTTKKLRSR
jgi:hydrogenase maturation factor HypF (carbamoyltransferase family)